MNAVLEVMQWEIHMIDAVIAVLECVDVIVVVGAGFVAHVNVLMNVTNMIGIVHVIVHWHFGV